MYQQNDRKQKNKLCEISTLFRNSNLDPIPQLGSNTHDWNEQKIDISQREGSRLSSSFFFLPPTLFACAFFLRGM